MRIVVPPTTRSVLGTCGSGATLSRRVRRGEQMGAQELVVVLNLVGGLGWEGGGCG